MIRIEIQAYGHHPSPRILWRNYMIHTTIRKHDWWHCVAIPARRR